MGSMPIDSARDALGRVGLPRWDTGLRVESAPTLDSARTRDAAPRVRRPAAPTGPSLLTRARARARLRIETNEEATTAGIVLALAVVSVAVVAAPLVIPWVAYLPFVVLSGALHSPRWHAVVLGIATAAILITSALTEHAKPDGVGAAVATLAVGVVTLWRSISRAKVGVQGSRGETMLADLRTRLLKRARVPALPAGWHAETCVESAYSHRFSGDFVVTRRTQGGRLLEVTLVDISGKGLDAGTRSLVLSGAFDALIGSVPPADFMVAANDYVARQEWAEGFASAVYLCLDLHTGEYAVSIAGHPPVALYDAETAAWRLLDMGSGPVLGLVGGLRYPCARGVLARGEALMLYTDGLIEDRSGDVDQGIARLVAALDTHADGRFAGIAQAACVRAVCGPCDDRGAVVVWRD